MRINAATAVKITVVAVLGILFLKWLTTKVNIPVVGPAVQKV